MRCHSQALTIKLNRDIPLREIEGLIGAGNAWVRVVPNEREASIRELCARGGQRPHAVPIGRLRKLAMGGEYSVGIHGRRSAAVGRRGAAAPHDALPAERLLHESARTRRA